MMNLSHRPFMTLSEYYAKCARCPFKDMPDECKRAQGLRSWMCYKNRFGDGYIRAMLEEDRELLVKLG